MKKNLGYLLLMATILTGCSDSANQVKAEKVEQVTTEQQDLVKVYKNNIKEDLTMILFKDFYRRFVEGEGDIEISDDLIKVFNDAIKKEINDGVEKYHDSKNWINEDFVSEENKEYITDQELKYIEETKKTLIEFIEEFDGTNPNTTAVDSVSTYGYLKNNEEIKALTMFVEVLRFSDSETTLNNFLRVVNPYYSGEKGAEMKKFLESKGIYLAQWVTIFNNANGTKLTDKGKEIVDYNPVIGMTAEEVKNSAWGKPQSVNRTVTSNSVSEQWVYPNYKYIYFENGIMTSFQD